ncbi:sensor histidine kinase [Streptomyces sp. ET3-23]|uniref:GAF domain-containing sensor histidine kinase n=1 Tax=Streptomyces sp. ET3-23 TaxID=2885643 RepID=UPI001D122E27|nr:ATP-binding protein [Streptomyces sp. ET3-23]MCC2275893.1 sensor histidine kinase [Streptomyces sp. ET3-23]
MRIAAISGGLCLLWAVAAGAILLRNNTVTLPWILGSVLPCYCAGLFAWWHAPANPVARRLLLVGTALASSIAIRYTAALLTTRYGWDLTAPENGLPSPEASAVLLPTEVNNLTFSVLVVRLLALLPDGRYRFRHERVVLGAFWGLLTLPLVLPLAGVPTRIVELAVFYHPEAWLPGVGAALLVVRCLRARAAGQEDVARLLPLATAAAVLFLGRGSCRLFRTWHGETGILYLIGSLLGALPYVLISLSVVYAAFRYRFLGVDIVIRREVVYGTLWLIISAWYLGMAMTLGLTAGQYFPIGLSVLVAVTATALFQPVRERLNQLAERRVFGKRLSSFELIVQFGTALEHAYDLDRLAPQLAAGLQEGLNLQWVRIRLGGEGLPAHLGAAGEETDRTSRTSLPLWYGHEVLGLIEYGPKTEGRFTPEDHDVVETLARQAALAVHNVHLAAELSARVEEVQRQAGELDASRARIVHAQDGERRRIERRLHDGIQQDLVALVAKLRLARNRLARGGDIDAVLTEVQDDAYRVIDELREVAHGIHPPVLTDQGLVAAVTSRARRMPIPVTVHVEDSLDRVRFALEVEESAFYLVSEALTNVLKHADATHATIRITRSGGWLVVEVTDDGVGFSGDPAAGSGLTGMRDRIEAVGGDLLITSRTGGGTVIRSRLAERVREDGGCR